jgi:hypothetical protein
MMPIGWSVNSVLDGWIADINVKASVGCFGDMSGEGGACFLFHTGHHHRFLVHLLGLRGRSMLGESSSTWAKLLAGGQTTAK